MPASGLETSGVLEPVQATAVASRLPRGMESILLRRRSRSAGGDECDGVSGSRLDCHNARRASDRLPLQYRGKFLSATF